MRLRVLLLLAATALPGCSKLLGLDDFHPTFEGAAGSGAGGDAGTGNVAGLSGGGSGATSASGATGGTGAMGGTGARGGAGAMGGTGAMGGNGAGGTGASSGDAGTSGDGGASGDGGVAGSAGTGGTETGGLIFSEYVEGHNYTALEVYNAGSAPVDLSACYVSAYGDGSFFSDFPLATTLQPGSTYVLCSSATASATTCQQSPSSMSFNGNDAQVLKCGANVMDVIGQLGTAPANYWGTPPNTTQDHTLRRKCSITQGDTNSGDVFDPAVEWDAFGADDLTDLGKHCE